MEAHGASLRSETHDDELVQAIKTDYRKARIDARVRAILDFAVKLTRTPADIREDDIETLRRHGLSDVDIHDAVQVAAYFNYINRIADGLGVDLEPFMPAPSA